VTRQVTLTIGHFVADTLQEQARANALSPEEFVDRAAHYYLSERSTGRPARKLPAFLERGSDGRPIRFQFDLEESSWKDIQAVAEREGTSAERLLEHAVLLLIADLDSGRVATRFVAPAGEQSPDWEA
jgi:hypothetical protein